MISKQVVLEELDLVARVVAKWHAKFGEGIPGVDVPADDFTAETFRAEFVSEMLLLSAKLEALGTITGSDGA